MQPTKMRLRTANSKAMAIDGCASPPRSEQTIHRRPSSGIRGCRQTAGDFTVFRGAGAMHPESARPSTQKRKESQNHQANL